MIARWRTCRKPYSLRLLDGANDFKLNQYNKMVAFKAADFFYKSGRRYCTDAVRSNMLEQLTNLD